MSWSYQRMYLELLAEELQSEAEQSGEDYTQVNAAGDIGTLGFNVTTVNSS